MRLQKSVAGIILLVCAALVLTLPAQSRAADKSLVDMQDAFVGIAEQAKPSVVHLVSERRPFKGLKDKNQEEFFKMFPGFPMNPEDFRAMAAGSGVIVEKQGYILTNNHMVEDSDEIKIKVSGSDGDKGKEYEGRVIGRDPATDLAVIKVDVDGHLSEARLGDSSKLRVGQWAIAIGDPFGLEKTVTVGVISGLGRGSRERFGGPLSNVMYQDFIQTDASINPGNSGGPLLNLNGEVIGINTFIESSGAGTGFAIPINMAKEVYEQLVKHGEVVRGFLGVQISDMEEGLAQALKAPDLSGALVQDVISDTPAEKAGLRHGDIIRMIDGLKIENSRMLQTIVSHKQPGDKALLTILRNGEPMEITVELAKLPVQTVAGVETGPKKNLIGVAVAEIPAQLARPGEKGVIVTEVEPGGAGDKGELAKGDIILEVNMQEVGSVAEFQKMLDTVKPGQWVSFYVRRGDQTLYRAVKIPEAEK